MTLIVCPGRRRRGSGLVRLAGISSLVRAPSICLFTALLPVVMFLPVTRPTITAYRHLGSSSDGLVDDGIKTKP